MDFTAFKKIVYGAVQQAGGTAGDLHEPNVTPNFFVARAVLPGIGAVHVLCSSAGHWAFSSVFEEHECHLEFVDCPLLADILQHNFAITPLLQAELEGEYRKQPCHSEADIRYWKPETLGEGLFNWWD